MSEPEDTSDANVDALFDELETAHDELGDDEAWEAPEETCENDETDEANDAGDICPDSAPSLGPETETGPPSEAEAELETDADEADEGEGPPSPDVLREASRAIEAMVMVAIDPVEDHVLAQILELPVVAVREICAQLAEQYRAENRGFEFAHVAGGWRYQTHPDQAPYIERYVLEGQTARLSSAALETLAIVAYKQPVSRGQVSAIRGVNVDGVLRTLVQRGYVAETGKDLGPGQATLFGTTQEFLERLGLSSIDDLPPLGDFVPSAEIVEALEQTLRAESETEIDLTVDEAELVGDGEPSAVSGRTVEPAETANADALLEDESRDGAQDVDSEPAVDLDGEADLQGEVDLEGEADPQPDEADVS